MEKQDHLSADKITYLYSEHHFGEHHRHVNYKVWLPTSIQITIPDSITTEM